MPESFADNANNTPNGGSTEASFGNPDAPAGSTNTNGDAAANGGAVTREELEKLTKRFNDSQEYIKRLEAEGADNRRQLEETAALLERLNTNDELKRLLASGPAKQQKEDTPASVDPDQIVKQVLETVRNDSVARETAAKQQANFKQVSDVLVSKYGKEAVDAKVKEVAEQHNLSFADAVKMARNSPTVFLKLFPEVQPPPSGTQSSSRNSAALESQAASQKQSSIWLKAKSTRDKVAQYRQALEAAINNQ